MKFYVAAYIGEKDRVQTIYKQIRHHGHEITVDWTDLLTDKSAEKMEQVALRDIAGIQQCDVFVLLADIPDGRGKYVELGAAIMSNLCTGKPRVYAIGQSPHPSVFCYHPQVKRLESIEDLFEDLEQ